MIRITKQDSAAVTGALRLWQQVVRKLSAAFKIKALLVLLPFFLTTAAI